MATKRPVYVATVTLVYKGRGINVGQPVPKDVPQEMVEEWLAKGQVKRVG